MTNFSPAQTNVINDNSRALIVEAVAGSGKTTVIMGKIAHIINEAKKTGEKVSILYLVFAKKNAVEANDKLARMGFGFPQVQAKTFHSLGSGAVRKVFSNSKLDDQKIYKLMDQLQVEKTLRSFVKELCDKGRNNAIGISRNINDRQAWLEIVAHHNLTENFADSWGNLPHNIDDLIDAGISVAINVLKLSIEKLAEMHDYTDQIYAALLKCSRALWKHTHIFVDECQDSNPLRILTVKAVSNQNSKLLFVGDRKQAIFGFTGADNKAMDTIKNEFGAKELPLSVSFRCSKAAVKCAQQWVSHIQAHENAKEGSEQTISLSEFTSSDSNAEINFTSLESTTDVVLCRNTKPLVEMAYFLISNEIPAYVEGRDLAKGLEKLVRKIAGTYKGEVKNLSYGKFVERVEEYQSKQIDKLMQAGNEGAAAALNDQIETILVIAERCADVTCILNKIQRIFGEPEDNKGKIRLMTIHKSKGLEFDRVFWLGLNRYQPSPFARMTWMLEQEFNLCYVAATRSKDAIIHIAS